MLRHRNIPFCLILALLALGACDRSAQAGAEENAVPARAEYVVNVLVQELVPAPMRDILVLPGQTEALKDVRLAAQRAGVVEWVGVTEGDTVKAGQVIARIDLAALKASLDRARANVSLAEDQLRRRKDLFARNVLAGEELEQAQNELTVARTVLREAQVAHDHGIVTSTLGGVVNMVYVDPGEFVGEGDPVAEIVDAATLRVNFNVPESDVRYLAQGQAAEVSVDAWPDETWPGTVDFVAWKADPATRTFQVRVVVDNAAGRIRPGMIARAAFLRRQVEGALSVPLFTVQDKGGERVVFVEEGGVARARTVQLGVIEGDRVQVVSGLAAGERLIVAGHTEVEDGTKVNVR